MRKLLFVFAALFAFEALAQPAVLTPASPTSSDIITATFIVVLCPDTTVATVVTGSLVTTTVTLDGCFPILPPLVNETATFGPLPPGIYTYEIYVDTEGPEPPVLRSRQTFAVQAPPIPSLSTWGVAVMAAALGLAALFVMKR